MSRDLPDRGGVTIGEALGLAAAVVGLIVMLGWILGQPNLSSLVPGTLTMKPNTALAFIGLGLALVLDRSGDSRLRRLSMVLALAVGVLAGVIGLQYVLKADFGIDQALFRDLPGAVGTVDPGRMSPQTVIALLAIAIALAAARRPNLSLLVGGLALIPILLGSLNLLDAVLGAETPTFLAPYTQMALPTAALCVALGIGVIGALPDSGPLELLRGPTAAARLTRRLVAAAIGIPVVLGWLRLEGERAGYYESAFGVALVILATILLFLAVIGLAIRRLRVAEIATERAARELSDLYEGSPAGYHSLDEDGRFVRVNRTELEWLGYDRDALIGSRFSDLLTPASADRFSAAFPAFRRTGRVSDLEFDLIRRDGSILPVLLNATAVHDENGAYVMSRSTLTDISARREAERAREEARQVAESANQAKSEFLGRMSHELRTPLNSVLGFGQMLEMGELDDEQREFVRYIAKAGSHLLQLIDEVIDISRIESGTMSLSPEPVEVGGLVEDLVALVQPMAAARRITLQAPGTVRRVHVLADRQRFRQVLLNLLSNAVKYNRESGEIAVECTTRDEWLRVSVSDSGHGIPPDQLERLFVPFDRLGAEATGIQGTGIGLALSRSLAEAMGGRIGVESQLDVETTFWVELPVTHPHAALSEPAAVASTARPGQAPDPGSLRTILHIDDNLTNLHLVERVLQRRAGVRVVPATHARLGLDLARTDPPDLVLLDLHLPDMTGIEALRELRRHPVTRSIPVIIVSADAGRDVEARVLAEGAVALLTKPLDLTAFLAAVDGVLAGRDADRPAILGD